MMRWSFSFLLVAIALVGCGGDDDGGDPPDAGGAMVDAAPAPPDASAGLLVVGDFQVENVGNVEVDANHRVNIALRITRGGEPVTNAVVQIIPAPPSFQTYLTGEPLDPSLYTGWYNSFHMTARIAITADNDSIPEVTLVGQELFRINEPTPGTFAPPGEDLVVRWSRPGATADVLEVFTDGGYDSGALSDADSHTIPGTAITSSTVDDGIVVKRWHENTLAAGADGSVIRFGVATYMPFTVDTGT